MILAPLRGVTIRSFRQVFAGVLVHSGFTEVVTPFITANPGVNPLADRELRGASPYDGSLTLTPQLIGKHPEVFRDCLIRLRDAGWHRVDLNAGCPYPMVRNKGRGSGLLRTPSVLDQMLEVGCSVLGPGNFSVKTRLGMDRPDEILELMPIFNRYPLRYLTVHARTARQMYDGVCNREAFERVVAVSKVPVVANGDIPFPPPEGMDDVMIGRSFIRSLADRADIFELLSEYIAVSRAELFGDRPVLGRLKELLAYFSENPRWRMRWSLAKTARSVEELMMAIR